MGTHSCGKVGVAQGQRQGHQRERGALQLRAGAAVVLQGAGDGSVYSRRLAQGRQGGQEQGAEIGASGDTPRRYRLWRSARRAARRT